jgi:hypothetical protein
MSHSLFTSWASMSILSFPRMHMTIQTSRRPHRVPTNNQRTPQTALSSCSWRLTPPTISTPLTVQSSCCIRSSHHGHCFYPPMHTTSSSRHRRAPPAINEVLLQRPYSWCMRRKERMDIDALFVLSWHRGAGTCSFLFSWKGFTKIYVQCFILEPICNYIYVWLHCEYACILKYRVVVVVFNGRCFNKRYEVGISVLF